MGPLVKIGLDILADALLTTPAIEGERRNIKLTTTGITLLIVLSAVGWFHVRMSSVEAKVDRVVSSTERLEDALIRRGAHVATRPGAARTPPPWWTWSVVPNASASER